MRLAPSGHLIAGLLVQRGRVRPTGRPRKGYDPGPLESTAFLVFFESNFFIWAFNGVYGPSDPRIFFFFSLAGMICSLFKLLHLLCLRSQRKRSKRALWKEIMFESLSSGEHVWNGHKDRLGICLESQAVPHPCFCSSKHASANPVTEQWLLCPAGVKLYQTTGTTQDNAESWPKMQRTREIELNPHWRKATSAKEWVWYRKGPWIPFYTKFITLKIELTNQEPIKK